MNHIDPNIHRLISLATTTYSIQMNILKSVIGIAGMMAMLSTSTAQSWIMNGLVAYYPFNGNANDESGHGNNGIVVGSVTPSSDRFGQANSAYHFDGNILNNQCSIDITNAVLNLGSHYTLSMWFASSSTTKGEQTLFNTIPHHGVDVTYNHWDALNYLSFYIGSGADWATGPTHGDKTNYLGNSWHSCALVKNGIWYALYVDGQFSTVVDVPDAISYTSVLGFRFGSISWGDGNEVFEGSLDDIRIYNRALSTNEVAQLYAIESQTSCRPHKATANARLDSGFVVGATIADPGCGYTDAPAVSIQGGGGNGATAVAVVSNGVVVRIIITDAGFGYTNAPQIVIGSPPFVPTVSIAVSKVKVTQNVALGRTYVLESSADLVTWTATGPQFIAQSETIVSEFDVDVTGRYFRIRQVP